MNKYFEGGKIMPETLETHKEIVAIKKEVSDIKATQELAILLERDKYEKYVERIIGNSLERAKVFLAVNGFRKQIEIANLTGIKPPNVARAIKKLEKAQLVYRIPETGIYAKPRWVRILNIEEKIKEKFKLSGYD